MNRNSFIIGFLLISGCVEPFDSGTVNYDNSLVIEGSITNETKQHQVSIKRTARLNESTSLPEQNAVVVLKDSNGSSTTLTEVLPGIYRTPFMSGTFGTTYSLQVTTSNGRKYISEKVSMKNPTPIDRISARYISDTFLGDGIQISVDSKDVTASTHYYRWEYEETYEIKTPYPSRFIWTGGNTFTVRTNGVDNCWATDASKTILVQSTIGLEEDKVTSFPLRFIPASSPEFVIKYSILVRQYSMSEKAYRFWKQLREINEVQGSLFDKQVGKVIGNFSSTSDEHEVVLGNFEASAVTSKRVFFTPRQFRDSGYVPPLYLQSCVESAPLTIPVSRLGATMAEYSNTLIIADAGGEGPDVVFLMRVNCCDCTSRGTNIKPNFWE